MPPRADASLSSPHQTQNMDRAAFEPLQYVRALRDLLLSVAIHGGHQRAQMLQYMGEGIKELRHSNYTEETAEPVSKQPEESTHGNKIKWVALQRDGWITQTQTTANVISEHIECQSVA